MSSKTPDIKEIIALGGFLDTSRTLFLLVLSDEDFDANGKPMYGMYFMPPRTKIKVVSCENNRVTLYVIGCDWPLSDEDKGRMERRIFKHECVTGILDLEIAL